MACRYGHLIICVVLSHLMQTALHEACSSGHVVVARTLTQGGARMDLKDIVSLLYVHDQCCVSGLDRCFLKTWLTLYVSTLLDNYDTLVSCVCSRKKHHTSDINRHSCIIYVIHLILHIGFVDIMHTILAILLLRNIAQIVDC